ncbi:hypothetical protein CPB86DRAFT_871381 [Serendipita vermifera]|nr:hypothetical protein CPB86DRAFT_871381 [Serendipita vermifera]
MDAPPPSCHKKVQTLTIDNLRSLPHVSRFVQAFVAEQRGNAAYYAKEAPYLQANLENPETNTYPEKAITDCARDAPAQLASPPLVARVQLRGGARKQLEPPKKSSNRSKSPPLPKASLKVTQNAQEELFYGHSRKRSSNVTKARKQKPASASDEEEYRERLAQRKERKRAKQKIVKPPRNAASTSLKGPQSQKNEEAEDSNDDTNPKISKKRSKKRALAPGIALMESFTAANVNKTRLTVKPNTRMSVFEKGKQSDTINLSKPHLKSSKKSMKTNSLKRHSAKKRLPISTTTDSASSSSIDSIEVCGEGHSRTPELRGEKEKNSTDGHKETRSYSESWGIGSELPSEDTSIKSNNQFQSRATSVASERGIPDEEARSNQSSRSPQPSIMKMSTHWSWNETINCYEGLNKPSLLNFEASGGPRPQYEVEVPTSEQPNQFPMTELLQDQSFSPSEGISFYPLRDMRVPLRPPIPSSLLTEDEEVRALGTTNQPPKPNNYRTSPDSLEHMLAEYDEEAVFYDRVLSVVDRGLPNLSRYRKDETEDISELYREDFSPIKRRHHESPSILPYDHPLSPIGNSNCPFYEDWDEVEVINDNQEMCDADEEWKEDEDPNYQQLDPFTPTSDVVEAVYNESDENRQSVGMSTFSDVTGNDFLPLSQGRLLLMGLEESTASNGYEPREANRVPIYGQSAREIEVAIGREISYRW